VLVSGVSVTGLETAVERGLDVYGCRLALGAAVWQAATTPTHSRVAVGRAVDRSQDATVKAAAGARAGPLGPRVVRVAPGS
jgi:hypothetical protein